MEVAVHVSAVGFALMGAALEVSVLVENDLSAGEKLRRKRYSVTLHKSLFLRPFADSRPCILFIVISAMVSYNGSHLCQ